MIKASISIFLAEDDEDDVLFFSSALSELLPGAELTVLYNGEMLIKHLETQVLLPDMIFLDLNMPVKNGFECLKEIKGHSSWKGIKTIVLSTTSDDRQIKLCYSLGADVFLTKPSSFDKLKLDLKSCLFN